MNSYVEFLASKALVVRPSGRDVAPSEIHQSLFPFQRDMTRWSLRKGRAALFETTGLGKTRQQIEWARLTGERCLILAPLAVARQTDRDLGNTTSDDQFWQHFGFISRELRRLMKPGRNVCVHVAQIPSQKAKDGVIGLKDFRGDTIRHFQSEGFVYHGEVCIDKDPQAQAIRTKSKGLLFNQMRRDAAWSRPALADYILIFRAPGENAVPIHPDISNDDWISWARPIWYGIRETDTLNVAEGREADDERHICPLQLGTIERCVRLWSNPGETVLSPFAGIGSEGYVSIKQGRRFIGSELKPSYWRAGVLNLKRAEQSMAMPDLFSGLEVGA